MVIKRAILLLLLAVACGTFQEGEGLLDYLQDEEFQSWISQYYGGQGENLAEIYPTWRRNADFVKHQNTLGLSYTLSINKFAHLDIQDLVKRQNKVASSSRLEWSDPGSHDIPSSVDWRDKGVLPPVVDQGQCDSSFFNAALDSVDAFWAIKNGHLVLASREECKDCCLKKNGCGGGTPDVFECIIRLGGLVKEGEYVSPNHTCLSNKYPPVVKISGVKSVAPSGDEQALAVAVARQPIVAAVDASHTSFQFYQSGIYYEPKCSSEKLDHTMLVVGYGSLGGKDFWIVKNSWGESWGMNGYILMARNKDNSCGIATQTVYPY